ncbi:hypothetical protein TNIN_234741 [Trichonephila inaurata madagascariensis]|uniref:Uncharacterized protein n=1 Tax=Trichonephila inaurata madagascariensis TaxID=2747483 RepID=A0A8X6YQQ0_9ARAC|nr:hypothetical protein TNIN_234741 [Trichonephila inaurata madagascariensis]
MASLFHRFNAMQFNSSKVLETSINRNIPQTTAEFEQCIYGACQILPTEIFSLASANFVLVRQHVITENGGYYENIVSKPEKNPAVVPKFGNFVVRNFVRICLLVMKTEFIKPYISIVF